MEVSLSSPLFSFPAPNNITQFHSKSIVNLNNYKSYSLSIRNKHFRTRNAEIGSVEAVIDPAQAEITWQIVVGAIAGVSPFVVAGIEFSKRIVAQKRCNVCGGSGLVLTEKGYFKCPGCGGFLPWQSWKRFFTG